MIFKCIFGSLKAFSNIQVISYAFSSDTKTVFYSFTFDLNPLYIVLCKVVFLCYVFRIILKSQPWNANSLEIFDCKFRHYVFLLQ